MKIKNLLPFLLFFVVVSFASCSKSKDEAPKEQYLIRVKNTSNFNYLDVRIIPVPPMYFHNFGKLAIGETSAYYTFDKAYAKIDADVQHTENFSTGLLHQHENGKPIEQLAPGKYLIEVKLTRNPNYKLETKVIKEE